MDFRRRKRCALSRVDVRVDGAPPPSGAIAAFLSDAGVRIDAFFDRWNRSRNLNFFPSDYESVYAVLRAIREENPQATRLCEWGSGFGVIAGLGAILGYEAWGIEIDGRCVAASRSLLKDHGIDAQILEGSFIPEEYAERMEMIPAGTGTVLSGPGAIDEVDVEIDHFDVIFAYPWPDEQEMYLDLFSRYAAVGAMLVTYSALHGICVHRAVERAGG